MEDDYFVTVDHEGLEEFLTRAYEQVGVLPDEASLLANSLVQASLRGNDSHGVLLSYPYFQRIKNGNPDPIARPEVTSDTHATAVVDGNNGIGQVVSQFAMQLAIEKADRYGVGIVGARNSNHYGAAAYWSMMALKHDMIGMTMTNSSPLMAPWGGVTPVLGSSPISVAVPTGDADPVVLDMATTMIAGGKLRVAQMRGEEIPIGWAVGPDNEPTRDPTEALGGRILPVGGVSGYKGYGLALIVDIFSAIMMGSKFGMSVSLDPSEPRNIGHFFQAIKISHFMPLDQFKSRLDALLGEINSSELEPGVEQIYYAGQKEFVAEKEQRSQGLRLDGPVYDNLEKMSEELNLPLDIRIS